MNDWKILIERTPQDMMKCKWAGRSARGFCAGRPTLYRVTVTSSSSDNRNQIIGRKAVFFPFDNFDYRY